MNSFQLAWKIRRHILEMTNISQSSHIGSGFSVADIIAVLYSDVVNVDPSQPFMDHRDRVILSKGHAGAAIYSALAEKGFFAVSSLITHCENGSVLSGHVSHKSVPGVEISTGSLGHGLSIGAGMAYAAKMDNKKHKVFVILSDGENDEGSTWEAALVANHLNLKNLIVIVDYNKMQSLDLVENTLSLAPLSNKWESFGWNVIEIDGHSHSELKRAFELAIKSVNKPTILLAHTIKGKGVSFMENNILWHYRYPHDGDEYDLALFELNKAKPEGVTDFYINDQRIIDNEG